MILKINDCYTIKKEKYFKDKRILQSVIMI